MDGRDEASLCLSLPATDDRQQHGLGTLMPHGRQAEWNGGPEMEDMTVTRVTAIG